MSLLIKTDQNTFKFYDDVQPNYDDFCNVNIIVNTLFNEDKYYYQIILNYDCSKNIENPNVISIRFYDQFNENNVYRGDIIVANEFSEKLVKYLLMDFIELAKVCGHGTPQNYKLGLIETIKNFWD